MPRDGFILSWDGVRGASVHIHDERREPKVVTGLSAPCWTARLNL